MGNLWLETPLIHSPHISARLGCNVYLKLEVSDSAKLFVIRSYYYNMIHRPVRVYNPANRSNIEGSLTSFGEHWRNMDLRCI